MIQLKKACTLIAFFCFASGVSLFGSGTGNNHSGVKEALPKVVKPNGNGAFSSAHKPPVKQNGWVAPGVSPMPDEVRSVFGAIANGPQARPHTPSEPPPTVKARNRKGRKTFDRSKVSRPVSPVARRFQSLRLPLLKGQKQVQKRK
jgi:hypothetical protein